LIFAVVFQPPADAKLDSYYLSVLREDIVVFIVPVTKFLPIPPKK
jgi:hypothetical protein